MVQQSKPWRANSFITEYSPWPGTSRSNTREVTEEPCTKNSTGNGGSPATGALSRLRYIHNGTSPFLAQYSLLQISPPSEGCAGAACAVRVCDRDGSFFLSSIADCCFAGSLADRHPDCETMGRTLTAAALRH